MLRYSRIGLSFLDELAQILFETRKVMAEEGEVASVSVKQGCSEYADAVVDICEKLGLVWTAEQEIRSMESKQDSLEDGVWQLSKCGEVKYHFYNTIYHCKAAADSCSILFNLVFGLKHEKEERDILRNDEFRKQIRQRSTDFASYWDKHGSWFSELRALRDQLIHREYLPILTRSISKKTVFDIVPNKITRGETTRIDFTGFVGTTGKHKWEFRRRGLLLAFPYPFDYVFPKRPINFTQLAMRPTKRSMKDFRGVVDYCHTAFDRLKGLSEITFKETLQKITK
jgi:hypothetical protein